MTKKLVGTWKFASELHDPRRGGVRGGAEDSDAPGGVLDDGEDVQARAGQGAGFEEVAGEQRLGLAAQELGPGIPDSWQRFGGSTAEFIHRMLTDPHHPFSMARYFDVHWFESYESLEADGD